MTQTTNWTNNPYVDAFIRKKLFERIENSATVFGGKFFSARAVRIEHAV